jgi:hypothetical protein
MKQYDYVPLQNAKHRREFPVGQAKIIAAPGWTIVVSGLDHIPGTNDVRLDPSRVEDLVKALKEAKQHQRGKNPR